MPIKIDGVLSGAESPEIREVLSLLDEIATTRPAIDPARQKLKVALQSFQSVHLTLSETENLYTAIQRLGALEKTLHSSYPKFAAQFDRFRAELSMAVTEKKGLEFQWQLKYEHQAPPSNLDRDPGFLRLLKRFGSQKAFETGAAGHVVDYYDAKSKEVVIIYLDMHTADNQHDIVDAISKVWFPAGFNQYFVENYSRVDGEITMAGCQYKSGSERQKVADFQVDQNYYNVNSPLALECLLGGALRTIGVDDKTLLAEVFRLSPSQVLPPPGAYRYYDRVQELHAQRDIAIASNVADELRQSSRSGKKAVLTVGYQHGAGIKKIFRDKGISYIEILPQSVDYCWMNDDLGLQGKPTYRF